MSSGVAIAIIASDDFDLLSEVSLQESLSSTWATLLVTANWYGSLVRESGSSGVKQLRISVLPEMDSEWARTFGTSAANLALSGSPLPPPIAVDKVGFSLYIMLRLAQGYLRTYAELAGKSFTEAVDELRGYYLRSLSE